MIVKNDLYDYKNRMIFQDEDAFKFSLDSILLAEFTNDLKDNYNVLDMCTGNCAIPLILTTYSKAKFSAFEIQKDIYNLACESIEYNNLSYQIKIYNDDINNIAKYFSKNCFDVITCNPPFFKVNNIKVLNDNSKKQIARHEVCFHLEDIFKISKDVLKPNGNLFIVHRAERLDEIIVLADKYKINVKKLVLVSTKKGKSPTIVLVKCNKNSKMGLKINNICIEGLNTYQNMFREI